VKLPLWRLLLAILVLAAMVTVLATLAPVYIGNYQLQQYVKQLMRGSEAGDDALRAAIVARAHQLDQPVLAQDIQITRSDGKIDLQTKYAVEVDFPLYQVDLHFHANGSSR
jgi:ABC-type dipeptide/oligopeptide/nickel transport system permease component